MADPQITAQTSALDYKRLAVAARPCPWCGAVAWDAGAFVLVSVGKQTTSSAVNFSSKIEDAPEQVRAQAQFVCTACAYVIAFQLSTTPPAESAT